MLTDIGSAVTAIIGYIATVVDAVFGTDGDLKALLPVFCLGIGVTCVMLGVRILRGFTWGN